MQSKHFSPIERYSCQKDANIVYYFFKRKGDLIYLRIGRTHPTESPYIYVGAVPTYRVHNIGAVPTLKMPNVRSVPMFKMHNVDYFILGGDPFILLNFGCFSKGIF